MSYVFNDYIEGNITFKLRLLIEKKELIDFIYFPFVNTSFPSFRLIAHNVFHDTKEDDPKHFIVRPRL